MNKVLVNDFGFTKTAFVLVLLGPPKTCQPKRFFSVTNQNINQNLHCQSETKIAKTLLTGKKPIDDEKKQKKQKQFW